MKDNPVIWFEIYVEDMNHVKKNYEIWSYYEKRF